MDVTETDKKRTAEVVHRARKEHVEQMLLMPREMGGIGLDLAGVAGMIHRAQNDVCKVMLQKGITPDKVGHEFFELMAWKHMFGILGRPFPWEAAIARAIMDEESPRSPIYASYWRESDQRHRLESLGGPSALEVPNTAPAARAEPVTEAKTPAPAQQSPEPETGLIDVPVSDNKKFFMAQGTPRSEEQDDGLPE
ncbi:015c5d5e-8bd0-4381-9efa-d1a4870302f7 [Thermothielavioides terrestris]|uniref:Uncharacterized protein n=2 Tax=Thermothielavioides terrestris TaxID=2587410 RepID=G2R187_THETT|nr:uncharacterized protein THITE_2088866 [Thermothielavioides terrestris NRRL 8126]AEO67377.1 hypothetical protein THITE_2088866 [Thermothielavioides terrestris NRRL 8126]SPQ24086.1 015c5d5e-8bd0-4381-9efa-d1a4870302f7 [Thermothielavioides terrestris]